MGGFDPVTPLAGLPRLKCPLNPLPLGFFFFFPDFSQAQLICGEDAIYLSSAVPFRASPLRVLFPVGGLAHSGLTSFLPLAGRPGHPAAGNVYLIGKRKIVLIKHGEKGLSAVVSCRWENGKRVVRAAIN